jgi:hypothetical protein
VDCVVIAHRRAAVTDHAQLGVGFRRFDQHGPCADGPKSSRRSPPSAAERSEASGNSFASPVW